MVITYIALGSNIRPETNLPAALKLMAQRLVITGRSRVYLTPPWGYAPQPDFLNAVVAAETDLPPLALLEFLLGLEARLLRERGIANGPRTMDLDLLFYGKHSLTGERLTLPHPRAHERGFVLMPLSDLAPEMAHPVLGKTMRELLEALPPEERENIRVSSFQWED